jgi:hypothetical protein
MSKPARCEMEEAREDRKLISVAAMSELALARLLCSIISGEDTRKAKSPPYS